MSLREQSIKMVDQDMRRAIQQRVRRDRSAGQEIPPDMIVRVDVSHEMWQLFYPALSFVPDDEAVSLYSRWHFKDEWTLQYWCVVVVEKREGEESLFERRTTFATSRFGEALTPTEISPGASVEPDEIDSASTETDPPAK